MKIAFFGTGAFSTSILKGIMQSKDIDISLIVSQPDKPVGRKRILEHTKIKSYALDNNIELLQPVSLKGNNDFFKKLKNLDFIVVVAYGKIVPVEVLESPKYGCINIHGSILPYYRGASPIQEAIKSGESKTGLTVMYMSKGMDEGDILKIEEIDIDKDDKTEDIFDKAIKIGPSLLLGVLNDILKSNIKGIKQDNTKATYCSKISKEDGKISFNKMGAKQIYCMYRSYHKWPGIFSYYNKKKINFEEAIFENKICSDLKKGSVIKNNKTIGIVCSDKKILTLKQVKLEGKKTMDIISFLNGNKEFLNYIFD